MSDFKVKVVSYHPEWPRAFEEEKARLLNVLNDQVVTIEHVGSTSIPGQAAKPVIDMFAGVRMLKDKDEYKKSLHPSGYRYIVTGMTGRHLFAKESAGHRTHHLHILPYEGLYERKEILFRDYLLLHPQFVKEYGELKRELADQYHSDPDGYTRAKTAFIQRVVDLARTERGLPLESVWEE